MQTPDRNRSKPVQGVPKPPRNNYQGIRMRETVRLAFSALTTSKVRTFLTSLGVVIGVASVVALLSIGQGAQANIASRITANGANLLTVRAQGASAGQSATLTSEDAQALADQTNVPDALAVTAEQNTVASVVSSAKSSRTLVVGAQSNYLTVHDSTLESGTFFDESNSSGAASVAVLGPTAATTYFPDGDSVGQTIRIQGQSFRVIGVLASKSSSTTSFEDSGILVPLETAVKKLSRTVVTSASGRTAVGSIVVQAKDKDSITLVSNEISAVLRSRHELPSDGTADDFTVTSQQALIDTLTSAEQTMTTYLSSIAAISLLVGGIGIMNIMLVSVRERTHEIGLIKALGARQRDILAQFLLETVALSTTSGIAGAILGVAAALLYTALGQGSTEISMTSLVLALGVSVAVGVFFGFDPARRAAKLDPIVALRYE